MRVHGSFVAPVLFLAFIIFSGISKNKKSLNLQSVDQDDYVSQEQEITLVIPDVDEDPEEIAEVERK